MIRLRHFRAGTGAIWLLFLPFFCLAQHPEFHSLNTDNGLPSNEVYDLFQGRDGFLWMGTDRGLVRYNGVQARLFAPAGKANPDASGLSELPDGSISCQNFSGQLFRMTANGLEVLLNNRKKTSMFPWFRVDPQGTIWQTGAAGLWGYPSGKPDTLIACACSDGTGGMVNDLEIMRDGTVWVARGNTCIWKIIDYQAIPVWKTNRPDLLPGLLKNRNVFLSLHGRLYLLTEHNKDLIYTLTEVRHDSLVCLGELPATFSQGRIFDIVEGPDNGAWICTQNGALLVDASLKTARTGLLFPGKRISDVVQDQEGNLWFSSLQDGVFCIRNLDVVRMDLSHSGVREAGLHSLGVREGKLLLGTQQGDLIALDPASGTGKTLCTGNNYRVEKTLQVPEGLLVAHGQTSFLPTGGQPRLLLMLAQIKDMLLLPDGRVAFARIAQTDIWQYTGGEWKRTQFLRKVTGRTLAFDARRGVLWVNYLDGIQGYRMQGDTLAALPDSLRSEYAVTCMAADAYGHVWAGTSQGQLLTLEPGRIAPATGMLSGIRAGRIHALLADGETLWTGSDQGIWKAGPQGLQHLREQDGLPAGQVRRLARAGDRLYVLTDKGLSALPVSLHTHNALPPVIRLEGMRVGDRDTALRAEGYVLAHHQNRIEIRFAGVALRSLGDFRYRFRLLGLETDWNETDSRSPVARYGALRPGSYRFEVVAVNEDGIPSTSPALLRFEIRPAFWQTWWFWLLVGLAVAALVYRIVYAVIQGIRRRAAMAEQLRISQIRAIKAQMNPHFMYNALASIQDMMLQQDVRGSVRYLGIFSQLMRNVLAGSEEDEITLAKEIEMLEQYLAMESLRFDQTGTFTVTVDPALDPEHLRMPSMVVQPFVENAIRHGLLHSTGEKRLRIHFRQAGNLLICTVEDNGVGRQAANAINQRRRAHHTSFATKASQQRLALLRASTRRQIELHYTDLYHGGVPAGTRVVLSLPC